LLLAIKIAGTLIIYAQNDPPFGDWNALASESCGSMRIKSLRSGRFKGSNFELLRADVRKPSPASPRCSLVVARWRRVKASIRRRDLLDADISVPVRALGRSPNRLEATIIAALRAPNRSITTPSYGRCCPCRQFG
jgi:hypothetical protein